MNPWANFTSKKHHSSLLSSKILTRKKMPAAWLPLHILTVATPRKLGPYNSPTPRKLHGYGSTLSCRATSSISDFDLYDLLGIDSSSDPSRIKAAYRSLQKQCHPDIAGPAGHDMAIILNEAYSLLIDPNSRLAYDKEQAKMAELRGYTGKPMYSLWFGSESEQRAVFVDEVKCVGCLKCALFARKTFAIESVYGRARVVAQWADPEYKIMEAIETCPVDCISMVERSDLPALEFLMSKQPRGNVRVGMSNTAGERVTNIFTDVKKFQIRFNDAKKKASQEHFKGADVQSEARLSAMHTIRSISNWLFWQTANPVGSGSNQNLTHITKKSPEIDRIQAAVSARKQARANIMNRNGSEAKYINNDEYWIPMVLGLPDSNQTPNSTITKPRVGTKSTEESNERSLKASDGQINPMRWGLPVAISIIATAVIQQNVGEGGASGLKEHVGGSLALQVVNSPWMQLMLTGITWFIIGMVMTGMMEIVARKIKP